MGRTVRAWLALCLLAGVSGCESTPASERGGGSAPPAVRDPDPPRGADDQTPPPVVPNTLSKFDWARGEPLRRERREGGLVVMDFALGEGPRVTAEATINVEFVARTPEGKVCDATTDAPADPALFTPDASFRGQPAELIVQRLPRGWQEGVVGMRAGGKRRLVIPYAMLYGEEGRPPRIPPRTDLTYDIELLWFSAPVERAR